MTAKTTTRHGDEPEPPRSSNQVLKFLTPAAGRGMHLLAAAGLWSLVGVGLGFWGLYALTSSETDFKLPVLLLAAGLGYAKARLVLFKTGARIVRRIEKRGDGRCIGGFQSWRNWAMVGGFVLLGRGLRATPIPEWLLGGIFLAVGLGLILASLPIWRHWWLTRVPAS